MMQLNGCRQVGAGRAGGIFPPTGRRSGSSFLEKLQKATDAASAEKTKDTLELAKDDAKTLLAQLTPSSKAVLERIQVGTNDITKDEWSGLCQELKTLGAISESDAMSTSANLHLIPIGYYDENGEFVQYDTPPMLKNALLSQAGGRGSSSSPAEGFWACLNASGWTGDPLAYLDDWMSSLYSWRSELARARNEDGSLKYSNLSPITDQINSCQKVAALVRELGQAQAGKGAV